MRRHVAMFMAQGKALATLEHDMTADHIVTPNWSLVDDGSDKFVLHVVQHESLRRSAWIASSGTDLCDNVTCICAHGTSASLILNYANQAQTVRRGHVDRDGWSGWRTDVDWR